MKREDNRDYYGFSLWHELLSGNTDWIESLDLGDPRNFDPEENGWGLVFSRLKQVHVKSGLNTKLGACFHISSNLAAMMLNPMFDMIAPFNQARKEFETEIPFELGMHCTFGIDDLPLAGKYPEVLKRDIELASKLGACCIVAHPPKGMKDCTSSFVQELVSDPVLDAFSKSDIMLAWENTGKDSFYGSLKNLLKFRDLLGKRLTEIGGAGTFNRHVFCLDTGHLLVWRQKNSKNAREIEEYLPEFAKMIKVFHIHANDGKGDNHLTPGSLEFFNHPSRANVNDATFLKNSKDVLGFLSTCEQNKGTMGRHVHVEALRLPFSLAQLAKFGQEYANIIKQ